MYALSPASEASREVANLTERKNTHTPVYGVKEFEQKNYPDFIHSQGGMKFATQISPLLNYYFILSFVTMNVNVVLVNVLQKNIIDKFLKFPLLRAK